MSSSGERVGHVMVCLLIANSQTTGGSCSLVGFFLCNSSAKTRNVPFGWFVAFSPFVSVRMLGNGVEGEGD